MCFNKGHLLTLKLGPYFVVLGLFIYKAFGKTLNVLSNFRAYLQVETFASIKKIN